MGSQAASGERGMVEDLAEKSREEISPRQSGDRQGIQMESGQRRGRGSLGSLGGEKFLTKGRAPDQWTTNRTQQPNANKRVPSGSESDDSKRIFRGPYALITAWLQVRVLPGPPQTPVYWAFYGCLRPYCLCSAARIGPRPRGA